MENKQKKNKAGNRSKLYSQEQEKGIMIVAWCLPQSNIKKNALVEQLKKRKFRTCRILKLEFHTEQIILKIEDQIQNKEFTWQGAVLVRKWTT